MYLTEHLLPGRAGNVFIWIAIFTALASAWFFYISSDSLKSRSERWRKLGRGFFLTSFVSLLGAGLTLYLMIFNRYYEYQYVWKYSSNDMPLEYVISCFWAGQEGSFIIWALFQAIIGLVAMRTSRRFEAGIMPVVALSQFFLLSMIWGIEVFGYRIGNSPFVLLREVPANLGLDFFKDPSYVSMLRDGNGLNPLLENFWMIIHPPVLFLGYAAALIPFSFAFASLRERNYREWLKPALPWLLFAILVLGTGILLGGAWAYVDLTFGGFWAWDPVENASLVPWLLMIAALHSLLISKNREHAYGLTYLLTILSFVFVIYASFLTRSGLLGDTSAHSFADDGLAWQMAFFLLLFACAPMVLMVLNFRKFPKKSVEDSSSREFWMFIASVVILLSAFQIIATTSLPVINNLFGTSFAPPLDRNAFYNNWQLPFAVLFALLAGFAQCLNYGNNRMRKILRFLLISGLISLALAVLIAWLRNLFAIGLVSLLFAACFATISSLWFLISRFHSHANKGALISHLGLGIFLAGIIFAFGQTRVISENTRGFMAGQGNMSAENQILPLNEVQKMGNYYVNYAGMKTSGKKLYYQLDFLKTGDDDLLYLDFTMYPRVLLNARMGNVYTPATKSFFSKDIFVHITYADVLSGFPADEYSEVDILNLRQGDTLRMPGYLLKLDTLIIDYRGGEDDFSRLSISAPVKAFTSGVVMMEDTLVFTVVNGLVERKDVFNEIAGHKYVFSGVSDQPQTIILKILEKRLDFVVVKVREFPLIWLVWLGAIIMFAGVIIAWLQRMKLNSR